jgi:hypothetical protein
MGEEAKEKESSDHLVDYRKHLVLAEQKAQEDFDKTVITLSGGALGISFAFIKDVVGLGSIHNQCLLLASWICWGSSITSILTSFYLSHFALRAAIVQIDNGNKVGGTLDIFVEILNALGIICFAGGIILLVLFVSNNIGGQ